MTYPDPIYGSNPLDPEDTWYRSLRPPLVNDPEMGVWQAVIVAAMLELHESAWLVRWRCKSPVTAVGVHLSAFGAALDFPRPDGWSDDRYRPAVVAIDGATLAIKPPAVTAALADALVTGAQTWEMQQVAPLEYVVVFYSLPTAEASTYRAVLEYGRPPGVRLILIYSEVPKADTFVLDDSLLDGPDLLAALA